MDAVNGMGRVYERKILSFFTMVGWSVLWAKNLFLWDVFLLHLAMQAELSDIQLLCIYVTQRNVLYVCMRQ